MYSVGGDLNVTCCLLAGLIGYEGRWKRLGPESMVSLQVLNCDISFFVEYWILRRNQFS
jgi:hypothetical protein